MTAARAQVVIAAIGLLVVVVQIALARRALASQLELSRQAIVADHDRRQKQATLEVFGALQKEHRDGIRRLRAEYGRKTMTRQEACLLRGDAPLKAPTDLTDPGSGLSMTAERKRLDELRDDLRAFLNEMERVAVGAQLGIYSHEVLRVQGKSIIERAHDRYWEYIKLVRDTADTETGNVSPGAYIAFSWLVGEFKKMEPPVADPPGKLKDYGNG